MNDLAEPLGIDRQRNLALGRLRLAGQQLVALFGVKPEPVEFDGQGRPGLPPDTELGE